jgi:hypothetical protein
VSSTAGDDDWGTREGAARELAAELADELAALAESFAAILERAAPRGDTERRLRTAQAEREIAQIARRNAARLRAAHTHGAVGLEHLPPHHLPPHN